MAPRSASRKKPVPRGTRSVYFETTSAWADCPVYWRDDLAAGAALKGPAIVEQIDSTTVLYPGDRARVDPHGNILMTVGRESAEGS
jgi:N-methylhydantoinase A